MKIAINLLQFNSVQGTEIFTRNIMKNLIRIEPNKFIFFISEQTPEILQFADKNVIIRNLKNKYFNALFQQTLFYFYLSKYKVDLLFSPSPFAPIFYKNKIITIHDCAYDRFPEAENFIAKTFFKVLYLSVKYFSKKIITVSEFSKKELVEIYKIKPQKIEVISEGVPEMPAIDEGFTKQVLIKFNLSEPYFLYIGNWRPRKNLLGLIGAFKKFLNEKSNFKLVIAGKKDKRFLDLEKKIKEENLENQVVLTDFISQEEKVALYKKATALVFVSFYEGFGLPVLEAQSLGVPVITSNTSALPETAGNGALLVNPYNTEEIKEAMIKIVEDQKLREELIQKGYENIKRFSWEKSAKQLLNIFDSL